MRDVDSTIFWYKKAYHNYHGRYPEVEKCGSWIRISGFARAFRSKELRAMTVRLRELKERRDDDTAWSNRESIWHIDLPEEEVKVKEVKKQNSWEKYVGEDIIKMFLNKLFSVCDNSAYTMEKCMKNFALSGTMPKELSGSEEVEYLKNALKNTIERNRKAIREQEESYKKIVQNKNKKIIELEKKIETLRENSVLFTMEDLEEVGYLKRKKRR